MPEPAPSPEHQLVVAIVELVGSVQADIEVDGLFLYRDELLLLQIEQVRELPVKLA